MLLAIYALALHPLIHVYTVLLCVLLLFTKGSDDRCDKENMYVLLLLFTKGSDDRCGEAVCDDHCEYDQMPGILDPIQKVPVSSLYIALHIVHTTEGMDIAQKREIENSEK